MRRVSLGRWSAPASVVALPGGAATDGYQLPPNNQKEGTLPLGHTGPHWLASRSESLAARMIRREDQKGDTVTFNPTMAVLDFSAGPLAYDVKVNQASRPPTRSAPALNLDWNFDNQLRCADTHGSAGSLEVTFEYDALGRRVSRSHSSGNVVYVHGALPPPTRESAQHIIDRYPGADPLDVFSPRSPLPDGGIGNGGTVW